MLHRSGRRRQWAESYTKSSRHRSARVRSRFGEQVNDYADLYTSRVSNFGPYSPLRYFRAPRRPMPHEI